MTSGATTPRVRLRRAAQPLRVELTPLIDVVFLLLTFFIYAMVLMERIERVPMDLRAFDSRTASNRDQPLPAVTLSLDANGTLYLDRELIAIDDVIPTLEAMLEDQPETVLYLAVADTIGPTDRVPVLLDLWDRLRSHDVPIKLLSKPMNAP